MSTKRLGNKRGSRIIDFLEGMGLLSVYKVVDRKRSLKMTYKHRQFAWVIFGLTLIPASLVIMTGALPDPAFYLSLGILGAVVFLFYALTVQIDGQNLRFWFGPGIIHKTIPLDNIVSYKSVRNFWLCGWGIRYFGQGWLYNVSGYRAVQLELKSGKKLRIGTDEPEALVEAIRKAQG